MRRIVLSSLLLYFVLPFTTHSQLSGNETSAVLEKLYARLQVNSEDKQRIVTNDSIISILDSYVHSDTVFNHRFSNIRHLGQITSPDSILKIVTWNLVLRESPGKYYCYFIKRQEGNCKNLIYRLIADYSEAPIMTDTVYCRSDWYGALYYDARLCKINKYSSWVLLGIDYGNPLVSRKIIDVISFAENDSVLFGKRCFETGDKLRYRDVFEYSSNGMMSLRFSSDSSIVFDHLVPFSAELENSRQFYGPDYSTDMYIFSDGKWKLKINVDVRNEE